LPACRTIAGLNILAEPTPGLGDAGDLAYGNKAQM
jgi:uracil phosphoribosyltransferase